MERPRHRLPVFAGLDLAAIGAMAMQKAMRNLQSPTITTQKYRSPPSPPKQAKPLDPAQAIVAKFSNWQRNQWARAGYPMSIQKLTHFLTLQRRPI